LAFASSVPPGAVKSLYGPLHAFGGQNRPTVRCAGHSHASLFKYNGSISDEHGIGKLKRESLTKMKDPVTLELMRGLKRMLDPQAVDSGRKKKWLAPRARQLGLSFQNARLKRNRPGDPSVFSEE
jgi:FAD-dependent oxidoreductase family protein